MRNISWDNKRAIFSIFTKRRSKNTDMKTTDKSRRDFIKKTAIGTAGIAIGGVGMTAKSYARILGSNDRIHCAVAGVHSRGTAHIAAISKDPRAVVTHICDVDSQVLDKGIALARKSSAENNPTAVKDFRKLVEMKDIDVITIATPEHWHAPMAIMGVQNDKHVDLEKPSSHNLHENDLLIEAQKKYGKLIQMGNQQRSAVTSIQGVQKIKEGVIGEPYHGRAWYAATRGSIGTGKVVAVPSHLDWELWQGPAPREDYRDNIVHYNWHWFRNWGTGEALNNGLHELDICRWAMGLSYPNEVQSAGGRFFYKDDWEFFDHQHLVYRYDQGKIITWEGNSCNGLPVLARGRGALIYGTKGSILLTRNGHIVYDQAGKELETVNERETSATMNTVGAGNLDTQHFGNFFDGIQGKDKLHSPIQEVVTSVNLGLLANVAQFTGKTIKTDPQTGSIKNNKIRKQYYEREYQPGWEPKV
ncbi:MAG: Gfo/Idh/MocA family oxidoreductase [Bacteroidales bacterium]|nr:Gfo/Idh/MocA family oxidoreductase [Bacteroidales bacterium]